MLAWDWPTESISVKWSKIRRMTLKAPIGKNNHKNCDQTQNTTLGGTKLLITTTKFFLLSSNHHILDRGVVKNNKLVYQN